MPIISGETKLLGLLSTGASYTLSPAMHNYAAQALQLDHVYCHFDLPSHKVETFLDVFWHMGGQGLNITVPYKTIVASMVNSQGLTSVNTLVRNHTGWTGYSTDGEGFIRGVERLPGITFDQFNAVITLGSGGAIQSILREMSGDKYRPLDLMVIHRRSKNHDSAILNSIGHLNSNIITMRQMSPESFTDTLKHSSGLKRLIIQGTSAPNQGDNLSSYRDSLLFLTKDDLFVDLNYSNPSQLYHDCNSRDLNALDGLPMLIEQARLSQFLWWGKAATHEQMKISLKNAGWRS
jgi:shikimate dehydrogenase